MSAFRLVPCPMPRRPTAPAKQASAAELRREVARLRARLARSQKVRRRAERDEVARELDVYREETRQQTEQLLETQQMLEESRDRYASLYDLAPIGYVTLDFNGAILEINLTGAEMLGVERARLAHTPMMIFVAQPDRKAFFKHLLTARRMSTPVETALRIVARGTGKELPVLLRTWATPAHFDHYGNALEFRSAIIDLSERHRAQEQERLYREKLRSLASELGLAEERERRRIAVEIHDHISQALAMAKMRLEAACRQTADHPVSKDLCDLADIVGEVLEQTRSLTFEVSPPVLYELGFEPALEWLAERAHKQYHFPVTVDLSRKPVGLPPDLAVLLFQAARELLVNVAKHAYASQATLRLRHTDGRVDLTVEDDGGGFIAPPPTATDGDQHLNGFGLFSIRARLEHLGGGLQVESRVDRGSRVTLTVPLAPQAGSSSPRESADLRVFDANNASSDLSTFIPPEPGTISEGTDDESFTRRRPSNRARRAQKSPRESA